MDGFNIGIKVDDRYLVGRTQDTVNIAANTKSSLTKEDKGNSRISVTGHTVTLKMSGIVEVKPDGTTTALANDEIMELALKKGKEAERNISYARGEGDDVIPYEGKGIITGYTEDSPAEGDATYSLDIQISGDFKKKTT